MWTDEKLELKVAGIGDLSRQELIARWEKAYGCQPPKGINRPLLERSAAWHLQAKRLGGLSATAKAAIKTASHRQAKLTRSSSKLEGSARIRRDPLPSEALPPNQELPAASGKPAAAPLAVGTRLMREWNGRMHVVDVTEQGILFDGKLFRSLTSVAKRITGAHWSGPRFFGL